MTADVRVKLSLALGLAPVVYGRRRIADIAQQPAELQTPVGAGHVIRHHAGVQHGLSLEEWAQRVPRTSSGGAYIPAVAEAQLEGDTRVRLVLRQRRVGEPIEIALDQAVPGATYILQPPLQTGPKLAPICIRDAPQGSLVIIEAPQSLPGILATDVPALSIETDPRDTQFFVAPARVGTLELGSGSYVIREPEELQPTAGDALVTAELVLDRVVELTAPGVRSVTVTTPLLRVGESLTLNRIALQVERVIIPSGGTSVTGGGSIAADWLECPPREPGLIRLSRASLVLGNIAAQSVAFESEGGTVEINPSGDCERHMHVDLQFRGGTVKLGGVSYSPVFEWCRLEVIRQARVNDAEGNVDLLGMPDAYLSGSGSDEGLWIRDIVDSADLFRCGELEDVHIDLLRLEDLKTLESGLDRFSPFPTLGSREQPRPGATELKRRAHFATELASAAERKGARGGRQAELRWGAAEARRLAARAERRTDEYVILSVYRCFGYGEKWLPPLSFFLFSTTLVTAIGMTAVGAAPAGVVHGAAVYLQSWVEVALHTLVLTRASGVEPLDGQSEWRWLLLSLQQVFGGLGLVFAALAARRIARAE